MIFLDANVFIYAFFLPERELKAEEKELKAQSRTIIERIEQGTDVLSSVVHLSEIANVLATCFEPKDLSDLLISFWSKDNVRIADVTAEDYLLACELNKEKNVQINDCLAAHLMQTYGVEKIYTFDADFTKFDWITIVSPRKET